jgi:RNA polymerase sigma-70 factor (ECF subfamily)
VIAPTGKLEKFNLVLARYEGNFLLMAQKYASRGEAADLYQEIMCRLWKSLDGFEGRSDMATWAYRIALNTALTHQRDAFRRDRALRSYGQNAPSEQTGGRDEEHILWEFTESLPDTERDIFTMYQTELSYREIAELARISEPVLRVKISRIKHQFEQRYL